jgi:hypothetical protein
LTELIWISDKIIAYRDSFAQLIVIPVKDNLKLAYRMTPSFTSARVVGSRIAWEEKDSSTLKSKVYLWDLNSTKMDSKEISDEPLELKDVAFSEYFVSYQTTPDPSRPTKKLTTVLDSDWSPIKGLEAIKVGEIQFPNSKLSSP